MLSDFIKSINWLDIVIIVISIRIVFMALMSGVVAELFKLLGITTALYFSLHYYSDTAEFLAAKVGLFRAVPIEIIDFITFIIIASLGYLCWMLLREAFGKLISMEAAPNLNRYGALFLGAVRNLLFNSILVFLLMVSSISYFRSSVAGSFSGKFLLRVAPAVYSALWKGVMSKFITTEEYNNSVNSIIEGL